MVKKKAKRKVSKKKATRTKARGVKKKFSSSKRGLWNGSIAFGLVSIPVSLESAQEEKKMHFRMIDKRDHAPIGYKQYNKSTGKEITRDNIVKGYEHKKNQYVIMNEADFRKANVKATDIMEIEDFVDLQDIDLLFFEKPYYILPRNRGEKGYALLREVLKRSKKAAIAKIVLHTVQRLAAIIAHGDYLVLETLRFANEVKELHEIDFLGSDAKDVRLSDRELSVAEQLVAGMSGQWNPEKYQDTYREDLMKFIKNKIRRGAVTKIEEVDEVEKTTEAPSNVVDLTALLKKSLGRDKKTARRKSSREAGVSHGA